MFKNNKILSETNDPKEFVRKMLASEKESSIDSAMRILRNLERGCSPEVKQQLLLFNTYGLDKWLDKNTHPTLNADDLIETVSDIIIDQDLPYERLIARIIIYGRNLNLQRFCALLLARLFAEDISFREAFIADKTYRPFMTDHFYTTFLNVFSEKYDETFLEEIRRIEKFPIDALTKDLALEYVYKFEKPYNKHQSSIIAIATFLSDKERVLAQLKKLEGRLLLRKQELEASGVVFKNVDSPNYQNHELLSGYLYQWAYENGFKGSVRINTMMSNGTMRDYFSKEYLFKDKAFRGAKHGEWTHFLQFYLFAEENKEHNILRVTPVELLKWLGEISQENVWDKTFEGDTQENELSMFKPDYDFRSFVEFNDFLIDDECKEMFPTLFECIYTRSIKQSKIDEKDQEITLFPANKKRKRESEEEQPNKVSRINVPDTKP